MDDVGGCVVDGEALVGGWWWMVELVEALVLSGVWCCGVVAGLSGVVV